MSTIDPAPLAVDQPGLLFGCSPRVSDLEGTRVIGERSNSRLTLTLKALPNITLDPWRIGKIIAVSFSTSTTPASPNNAQ